MARYNDLNDQFTGLDIDDEENSAFVFGGEEELEVNRYDLCIVGRFLTERKINVNAMKSKMADVWRPVMGINIKEIEQGIFLFQFYHKEDMNWVLKGGPWSFDNAMFVMAEVPKGEEPLNVPLWQVNMWMQIYELPSGFISESVGKQLGDFFGEFLEYDNKNNTSTWREFMRIRVRLDVRKPLKRKKKIMKRFDGSSEKVLEVDVDESEENDVGLFASTEYDEDDKEADAVWEKIENKMDLWMKDRREARAKQGIESLPDSIADTLLDKARQKKGIHYEMPSIRSPLDSFVDCGKFYEKFCVNCENSMTATRTFDVKSETKSVKVLNYKPCKDEHCEYLLKWRYKDRDRGRCDGNRNTVGSSQLAKSELCHAYDGMVHRVVEIDEWPVEEKMGIMLILMGAPGNSKSTFYQDVMKISNRPWIQVCQDITGNNKAETKVRGLITAATALKKVEDELMCYKLHEDERGKVLPGEYSNDMVLAIGNSVFPMLSTSVGAHFCWCTSVSAHFRPVWSVVGKSSEVVFGIFVIDECVENSLLPSYNHCRFISWGHHLVSKRKYRIMIPSDDSWNKPLKGDLLRNRNHLLHGLIHCNGYGHLLSISALDADNSNSFHENDIMELWYHICTSLQVRKVFLRDERNVELWELCNNFTLTEGNFGFTLSDVDPEDDIGLIDMNTLQDANELRNTVSMPTGGMFAEKREKTIESSDDDREVRAAKKANIVRSVTELHAEEVVCMNIKSSNLLLDANAHTVVSDYGLLLNIKKSTCMEAQSECNSYIIQSCMDCTLLSPNYATLETWEPVKKSINLFLDDVIGISTESETRWSFGCTPVEMCTGFVPWAGLSAGKIYQAIVKGYRESGTRGCEFLKNSALIVCVLASDKKIKIEISGIGRIGRLVARVTLQRDDIELVAVNDPFITTDYMTYMSKYDSVQGQWEHNELEVKEEKALLFGDKPVKVFGIRKPVDIPWGETGAAKAVGKVLPALSGKLTEMSFRVPVEVSVMDLTVRLEKKATYEQIKAANKFLLDERERIELIKKLFCHP